MDDDSAEGLHFKYQSFSYDLMKQLNILRQSRILTDVVLCSEGFEFPCHRSVLASSSPYFRAMFCHGFKESYKTKIPIIGIHSDTLTQIIDFVYTGEIDITTENILYIMAASSLLQYVKLFEACSSFLQGLLSPSNCLSIVRLSEFLNCGSLATKAKAMSLEFFPRVAVSDDLKETSLMELVDYLGDDELCGAEEQVFEAIIAWIRHDSQARQRFIDELFKKVRLRYVNPAFLFHFIANDPLIQSSPLCKAILESARRMILSLNSLSAPDLLNMWNIPRRRPWKELHVIVGGRKDNQQTTRETLLFDDVSQKWIPLAKLPVRLHKASSVSLHSNIYVLGGMLINEKKRPVSSGVYSYSLKLNQWKRVESMQEPRYSHRSITYKNCIYSLGGIGAEQKILNTVERYDSIFSVWESMSSMPVAVLHSAVAAKDHRIYLFGGEDIMQNPVRLIQVYNVPRNMWFRMETRMVKNVCAPAVVIGDRIIIVGGYSRRMVAYDTKTNNFDKCASMKDRKMRHGATVVNNKLYITGGRYVTTDNNIEDSDSIDCYDPETDSWKSVGKLPSRLFDHGYVTLLSIPYKSNMAY
ncbi:kelch-like protein 38 [Protopterus annectens]|uniref:kelch-like protein 38 n=1 Tax=Protopterus annectens TaxID=7888 RepID=UPI001CFAFD7F|nr:kelch-like protein 38 [Protopterus annectens]